MDIFTKTFIVPFGIAAIVFLWVETSFLAQYARLFHVEKFFRYSDWEVYKTLEDNPKYYQFIRSTPPKNRFQEWFFHLIGCPLCSITFISFVWFALIGMMNIINSIIKFITDAYFNINIILNDVIRILEFLPCAGISLVFFFIIKILYKTAY